MAELQAIDLQQNWELVSMAGLAETLVPLRGVQKLSLAWCLSSKEAVPLLPMLRSFLTSNSSTLTCLRLVGLCDASCNQQPNTS